MTQTRAVWNTRLSANKAAAAGTYRTQCKRCRRAIFAEQPAEWVSTPLVTGLVHEWCVGSEDES